ncbi:MAG: hypothetical protein FWF84_02635 [Kiritimatiellaeota bacterium]|nr:hypothetical protein [Kiritimatiellota bacterium]
MKITPMVSYKKPAYPTYEESKANARLLNRLPQRWGKNGSIASLVGTGILIHIAGTGRGEETATQDVTVNIIEPVERDGSAVTRETVRAIPATRVAPILEEALAKDGRGGFGCVAISAPVFLSENEALDLIQSELKKAGLEMHNKVDIDGLPIPNSKGIPLDKLIEKIKQDAPTNPNGTNTYHIGEGMYDYTLSEKLEAAEVPDGMYIFRGEYGSYTSVKIVNGKARETGGGSRRFPEDSDAPRLKYLAEGTYAFDLGTKDKAVVVKFLGTKDHHDWKADRDMSTWHDYNLAWLAEQMRDAFQRRADGDPVIIGLFFQPTPYPPTHNRDGFDLSGLEYDTRWYVQEQIASQLPADTNELARDKLRAQVLHFVDYLKHEGVVE